MSDTILLSIRPKYVEGIFNGTKKYEFRRVLPKEREIQTVLIYASAPVSQVVGEFRVGGLCQGKPLSLWRWCSSDAGITIEEFISYFSGCSKSYAYIIAAFRKYKQPFNISKLGLSRPPQNFCYIDNNFRYETK